ncbi:hypothetical protein BGZ58_006490 [Dissophora ornata]|nr:hypothetical protein BGZ58_006490 [Dissophora ornata]
MPMNGVAIGASGNHPTPPAAPPSLPGMAANADVLQQTRQDLQREVSHLSMLLGRAAAVLNGLDQALDPHHAGAAGSPPMPHSIRESGSPVGHGYAPPPHGLGHGHGPPPPQSGAPSSMTNDVKTSSALASLMALSASGGQGRSGATARHDEREMQHLQPQQPMSLYTTQPPQPQPQPPQQQPSRYPQTPSYPSYPLPRRSKLRRKLMAAIQQASPPGIMGIDAILIAQEEARLAEEAERQLKQSISDSGLDAESMYEAESDKSDDMAANDGDSSAASGSPTVWGYVPPPTLVHHAIPGTQATPVDMWAYTQHVFDQALDEIALKESILEALETIAELKDSGDDEMPTLLDQQLTNMVLLWELEPYIETVPERNEIERALGVISWQTESMK